MRRLAIGLLAGAIVLFFLAGGLFLFFSSSGEIISEELKGPFLKDQGYGWMVNLPQFKRWGDTEAQPENSTLMLFEDGRPLGPPHSLHDAIRKFGGGRFSHWRHVLLFSTSDNSDPNTNGRRYSIKASPLSFYLFYLRYAVLFFLSFILLGGVAGAFFLGYLSKVSPIRTGLLFVGGANLLLLLILHNNIINPVEWYGKIIHGLLFLFSLLIFTGLILLSHEFKVKHELSRGRKWAFRLCAVWSIIGTFIVMFEIFFRLFPVQDTLGINPGLKFFWPDYVQVPLNNMGYRDRPFNFEKPPDTYRIMVVGDSYTEGSGCSRKEVFTTVLEAALNRRLEQAGCSRRVEVYNLGRCGANTVEEVQIIQREAPLLQPDLIIMAYVLNDPEMRPQDILVYNPPPWMSAIHKIFLDEIKSYSYYYFFRKVTIFKGNASTYDDYCILVHKPDYRGWIMAKQAVANLSDFIKKNNYDFLTVIFPKFIQREYYDEMRNLHKQAAQLMQDNNLSVVDLLDLYEGIHKNFKVFAFSPDDDHPNVYAHSLAGNFLAEVIWHRPSFIEARRPCATGVVSR